MAEMRITEGRMRIMHFRNYNCDKKGTLRKSARSIIQPNSMFYSGIRKQMLGNR